MSLWNPKRPMNQPPGFRQVGQQREAAPQDRCSSAGRARLAFRAHGHHAQAGAAGRGEGVIHAPPVPVHPSRHRLALHFFGLVGSPVRVAQAKVLT